MTASIKPTPTEVSERLLHNAQSMAPTIQELGREIERAGRLPDELIEQFIEAGFFNMLVERELGGGETDPVTATKVIETISSADSSAGWVAMIGSVTPFWATALMPKEGAREIFGAGQDVVMVGTLVPYGRAVKTSGGYRISGSWPFGSGCQHANWLASACWLFDGEAPIQRDDGRPAWAEFLTPIQDCGILDTWHVTGMQGTGSHDYTIDDVFVPERRMFYHVSQTLPVRTEPRYSYLAATVALMAAVPLGIARAATDELRALLPSKAGAPEFKPMSEDFEKQVDVARADTLVGSASAYLYDTLEQVWGRVAKGEPLSKELRGRFRAACTNAVLSSVEAVDLVYATAGTTAIYTKSSLERRFRDVHTAAAHALVRSATRADAGRLLMELEPLVKIF